MAECRRYWFKKVNSFCAKAVRKIGQRVKFLLLSVMDKEYLKKMDEGAIADILIPMLAHEGIRPEKKFLKKITG